MTQKAEVSAVMSKLKVRTDKCNTEVVTQAQKRSQNGDQRLQAHMTKVTYTTRALVEDESDEDGFQSAREVLAEAPKSRWTRIQAC